MDEKTILINTIITKMGPVLQSDLLDYLYNILTISLHDYDVTQEKNEIIEYDEFDRFLCEQYYASLKVEGKSPKTIDRYMEQLRLMMEWVQKPLKEINSEDIRYYLALYQQRRKIASSTLDGMRRCICAFYSWAEFAGYIDKSPARRIKQIKFQIKKEPALTSGQIEKAMINCNSIRDKAIISFMYETGARVSEVAGVKLSDIDFNERTVLIHGKGGKDRLVITEIPYTMIGANIGKFLNDIYSLVETKKTSDIVDITNQSSKEGIRIVLELKKGADVENLKNLLYKKTKLEDTFGVNMLAVADGKPETMGIVPIIRHHVNFQYELATRKYQTLLAKERDKKEIQEGLIKATDVIDLIIEILRGSKNVKDARACLTDGITDNINFKSEQSKRDAAKLRFTERQTTAILEMRLQKLIGLELEALLKDHDETLKNIAKYEDILGSRAAMAKVIIKELESFKKEYAKPRKTVIDNLEEAVVEEKKIEEMDVVFLMDRFGYAKTVDVATYERNKEAANTENRYILTCKNTDKICIFTDKGQMHLLKVLDLPYGKFRDKGTPIDNLSNYNSSEENFVYITNLAAISRSQVLFGTKSAMLKVVDGSEFDVAKRTTAATKLNEGDELIFVQALALEETLVMQSEKDFFLRIDISSIPEKKKGAVGVRGMKLGAGDALAAIYLLNAEDVVNIEVKGKEVALNRLRTAGRDTKGTKR